MRILVTGSNGQLGSEIKNLSKTYSENQWIFTDIIDFDLSKLSEIEERLSQFNPDCIINCAAYTNVDAAETNKKLANIINNKAVKIIANWSYKSKCKLIHISTDYIFDGSSNIPIDEDTKPNPINYYGKSKLFGEISCLIENPLSIIIRTSWVYSKYGKNFVKTIIKLMNQNREINVINDQIGAPTYAKDLALVIVKIISHKDWFPGIYNYSNIGKVSWYDFALKIRDILGYKINIIPVKSKEFKTQAKRPRYSLLKKDKIVKTYKLSIPDYQISLKKCLKTIKDEK